MVEFLEVAWYLFLKNTHQKLFPINLLRSYFKKVTDPILSIEYDADHCNGSWKECNDEFLIEFKK